MLFIQGKQVGGQEHHGGVVFLQVGSLQGFHAGPPNWSILLPRQEESHGLFVDSAKVSQGFARNILIGVGETKSSGSRAPGFSDVGEVFTLRDVDGDFTSLCAVLFILTAFILGAVLDSKSLHGGMQKLREAFSVQAIAAGPDSFHFCGHGRNRLWWFAGGKLMGVAAFARGQGSRWKKADGGLFRECGVVKGRAWSFVEGRGEACLDQPLTGPKVCGGKEGDVGMGPTV